MIKIQPPPATAPPTTTTTLPPPPPPVSPAVPAKARIADYGDSLAVQAQPYLDDLVLTAGAAVKNVTYGGIAICDVLPTMANDARHVATERRRDRVQR